MENQEFENSGLCDMQEPAKKKSRRWLIVLIVILLCFIIAIGGTVIGIVSYIKGQFKVNYNDITSNPSDLGIEEVKKDEVINIALFGIDSRSIESFEGRSDTIIILSINTTDSTIKLTSVMRDSFVPIVKNGETTYNKINTAYVDGGPELAIKTLNTVFDLDISEYATVNLFAMSNIIDAVGGVEVDIVEDELKYINGSVEFQCGILGINPKPYNVKKAGKQLLSGIQAMAYARIRMTPNAEGTSDDFGRTDRQRYILQQMFNKIKTLEWNQLLELAKTVAPMCETSVSLTDAILIAKDIFGDKPQFFETRIPSYEYLLSPPKTDAGAIVYFDLNFAAKLIHAYIYNDVTPEEYISLKGIEKNDWYTVGFNRPQIDVEDLPEKEDVISNVTESVAE